MASDSQVVDRLTAALADRYAIEREIGAGGMATVYLAEDLKHHRRVAIKVLNPELAAAVGTERFLREIEIAANLTHPHILPVHDSGEADGFLYFVMPYVEGESLREWLDREKQLPVEDAVRLTREVADALAYAHERGLIHRDVKPANILLEAGHAVLADFGVAHAVAEAREDRITRTGTSLGTPAYMSPEQASGEQDLDGRSDLYSLGCVLYEMLAGLPPFVGAQVESVVRQHLTQEPPLVTQARPSVADEVALVINRALSKSPADRFKTTGEMAAALALIASPVPSKKPSGRVKAVVYASTIILGLSTTAVLASRWSGGGADLPEDRVAVMPFVNLTGDPSMDELGIVVAYEITEGLGWVDEIRAVSTTTVDRIVSSREGDATLSELGEVLESGTIVSGVIRAKGTDSLELHAQVIRVGTDEVVHSFRSSGPSGDPMEALEDLRQRIGAALALSDESLVLRRIPRSPARLDAYRSHLRGIELFYSGDYEGAIPFLETAFQLDSSFFEAGILPAAAYFNLGRYAPADSLLEILDSRRDEWTVDQGLRIDAIAAAVAGDWMGYLRAHRALSERDPAHLYSVARGALNVGRPLEALEALEGFDFDDPYYRIWRETWHAKTSAFYLSGDYGEALLTAVEGLERVPNDIRLLALQLQALTALGRLEEATALMDHVAALEPESGYSPGYVFREGASALARHGQPEAARGVADRAVEWYRDHGGEEYGPWLAQSLLQADRVEEALSVLGPLLENTPENADLHGLHGVALARTGDEEGAKAEALWLDKLDQPYLRGVNTLWRAAILAHLGQREAATRLVRQALREGQAYVQIVQSPFLAPLWGYEPFGQLIAPRG